ncbi:unnamed protein product [Spodoptera exigua]|nr:unnamed protein product [Spodoptera exigua]
MTGTTPRRFLSVFVACRSVPLIAILYYIFGAAAFGLARGKTSLDIALFPLEFTTSGGLERQTRSDNSCLKVYRYCKAILAASNRPPQMDPTKPMLNQDCWSSAIRYRGLDLEKQKERGAGV